MIRCVANSEGTNDDDVCQRYTPEQMGLLYYFEVRKEIRAQKRSATFTAAQLGKMFGG